MALCDSVGPDGFRCVMPAGHVGVHHAPLHDWCAGNDTPAPARSEAAGGEEGMLPAEVRCHGDLPETAWAKREEIWQSHNFMYTKTLVDEFANILRAEANERIASLRQQLAAADRERAHLSEQVEAHEAEQACLRQQLAAARVDGERYASALRDLRDNWDHDVSGHKHGTPCRVCTAITVLRDAGRLREWDARAREAEAAARSEPNAQVGASGDDRTLCVDGKRFTCECGANVFRRYDDDYVCNGCDKMYAVDPLRVRADVVTGGGNG